MRLEGSHPLYRVCGLIVLSQTENARSRDGRPLENLYGARAYLPVLGDRRCVCLDFFASMIRPAHFSLPVTHRYVRLLGLYGNGYRSHTRSETFAHCPKRTYAPILTAEQERLVKEIQEHKKAWATRNMVAQNKRQTISTVELTAFKTHHAELAEALARVNLQIGELNREVRANNAVRQNGRRVDPEPAPNGRSTPKKEGPIKRHKAFPVYFLLAAEQELDKRMFDKIVSVSESLLANALQMGIETDNES
jgi:hypothetical protein